jgi:hypothetical protein
MLNLHEAWPWAALLLLGALHGINPGMGWLFAVALGMQEERAAAVWRALPPLVLGHAVAIVLFVAGAQLVGLFLPPHWLKAFAAAALFGFGLYRLKRPAHPRYGGMRVGQLQLAIWSFLMASAHGAGLMVLPFVSSHTHAHGHAVPITEAGLPIAHITAAESTIVHSVSYLVVTGLIALIVYEKAGLRLLRTAWINLDAVWAAALMITALLILLV